MEHAQFYEELYGKLVALIGNERDWVANLLTLRLCSGRSCLA